jgi:hypothetical protein
MAADFMATRRQARQECEQSSLGERPRFKGADPWQSRRPIASQPRQTGDQQGLERGSRPTNPPETWRRPRPADRQLLLAGDPPHRCRNARENMKVLMTIEVIRFSTEFPSQGDLGAELALNLVKSKGPAQPGDHYFLPARPKFAIRCQ